AAGAWLRRWRRRRASGASPSGAGAATASCGRECATASPCRRARGRGSWPAPRRSRWHRRDSDGGCSQSPFVPAKAGTQSLLDSRFRGNDRSFDAAVVASLLIPPGGLALVEKCLDAFAPFGRGARFGDAARGQSLERVIDRATRNLGNQPFRTRL